jgi:hypothetical protein
VRICVSSRETKAAKSAQRLNSKTHRPTTSSHKTKLTETGCSRVGGGLASKTRSEPSRTNCGKKTKCRHGSTLLVVCFDTN